MNLVEQIFEQAKLGTAVDPNANPFATGVQLGQGQQRIDLEKRRLAEELARAPLERTLLQQKAEAQALEIESGLAANQQRIEGMRAFNNLDKAVGMALSEATPIDALAIATKAGTRDRALFSYAPYQAMVKQLESLAAEASRAQYYLDTAAARQTSADAAAARAELAGKTAELSEKKYELEKVKEERLREQFAYQQQKFERTVPADKLAIFRERAKSIQNDLSLIADAPKRDAALKALADELTFGVAAPAAPPAAPPPTGGFKWRIIKP